MINVKNLALLGISVGVLATAAYTRYIHVKLDKISTEVNSAVDKLSKNISVDVPDSIIDRAVNRAVEREVGKAIKTISQEVVSDMRSTINKEVKMNVDSSYVSVKASVIEEVSRQVANIDMGKLKAEVKEKAKELVIEKFDGNLNSLLDDFNNSLSNVSKIYSSIADSMTKKKESETVFKIGI